MTLTKQQIEYFKERIKEFKALKKTLDRDFPHNRDIFKDLHLKHGQSKSDWDSLRELRPTTPNGTEICDLCDIHSMKYVPKKNLLKGHRIYECEICGYETTYIPLKEFADVQIRSLYDNYHND